MAGHSDCLGVLRQLVRILSQSDDSCEKELVSLRKQCERKVFEGKNRVKRDLSVVYASSRICKCQGPEVDVCPVRYVLSKSNHGCIY